MKKLLIITFTALLLGCGLLKISLVAQPVTEAEADVAFEAVETNETVTLVYKAYYVGDLAGMPDDAKMEAIIKYIQTNVTPESWNEEIKIRPYNDTATLIIKQTEVAHRQVAKVLHYLRTEAPEYAHRLAPGDIIGIYIEGLTRATEEPMPVHKLWPEESNMPPAPSYAFTVRENGTIHLPKIRESINVMGLTLKETEELFRRTYEEQKIVTPDKTITVSLIRTQVARDFVALQGLNIIRIEGIKTIRVKTLDGKEYDAQIISHDPNNDTAVIKIMPTEQPKSSPPPPSLSAGADNKSQNPIAERVWDKFGLRVTPVSKDEYKRRTEGLHSPYAFEGALEVQEVNPDGMFGTLKMQKGDMLAAVITPSDPWNTTRVSDLKYLADRWTPEEMGGNEVKVLVVRNKALLEGKLAVKQPKPENTPEPLEPMKK